MVALRNLMSMTSTIVEVGKDLQGYMYHVDLIMCKNKPKGLKVAKEDKRSIGLMVDGLNGR